MIMNMLMIEVVVMMVIMMMVMTLMLVMMIMIMTMIMRMPSIFSYRILSYHAICSSGITSTWHRRSLVIVDTRHIDLPGSNPTRTPPNAFRR